MRPFTSSLLPAAFAGVILMADVSGASALSSGVGGSGTVGSPAAGVSGGQAFAQGLGSRGRFGRHGGRGGFAGCGHGRCGSPIYAGYGYGYGLGYGGYGYGFGDYGDGFDPRLLRGEPPSERESAVPAVAGIPAPPVQPPAIYVIGDGEQRGLRGRASSPRGTAQPRVVRVR